MQADLRAPDPSVFALAEFFRENEHNLIPDEVAVDFLTWLLTGPTDAEFRAPLIGTSTTRHCTRGG
jgi:hypothetical protein